MSLRGSKGVHGKEWRKKGKAQTVILIKKKEAVTKGGIWEGREEEREGQKYLIIIKKQLLKRFFPNSD